ncbi:MAG: DUF1631 family protein [Gammaproteobacteria bacterium]|nr:DUF1631 family protein [Gammaproteobacteria bacterium]
MQTNVKKILLEWEDEVATSLVEGFRQLFESSSQVLLEFADSAENNRLQRLFFDAQREFYLKEEAIINEFDRNLRDNLTTIKVDQNNSAQLGADTLSLVEKEDYERSLALETIAKRILNRQIGELHALSQRLSALLGGRPVPIEHVPANPLQIIRLFDPASRKLEVEKEVRLVFYTLFDRYVMSRLGDLYAGFNKRLVDIGILPNIKFDYQRNPSIGPSRGADSDDETAIDEDTDLGSPQRMRVRPTTPTSAETLSAISSLLMEKRRRQRGHEPPLHTNVPITATAANVDEAIADVRVLQEAPHPMPIPTGPISSKVEVDATLLVKVKGALEKQRQIIKSLVGREKLDAKEEDVIDIVGMLFEAMLNEKLLPNAVKTLLSHLHTRYLKIAVQSPDFLENNAHPARQLFERMLDSGIRWVREDNLRAGIYPKLQAIVMQILKVETPDDDFFNARIAELGEAEKRLEKQSTAAEDRTLESERGRQRLEQAKSIVQNTVDDLTAGVEVSPAVITFLSTTFADYLTLLLLRSELDTDSEAWTDAYSVGEVLIATAVHAGEGHPLKDDMRKDLAARLQSTVGSLIPHHEDNIKRVIDGLDAPAEKPGTPVPRIERPVVRTTADAAEGAASESPASAEELALADKLMRQSGNWFVIKLADGSAEQSVKLLWVNPHTRNMLFVDQHGAKVALMPATTLARKIREGEIRPKQQESSSFVARSLRRIRRALEDSVNT